MNKQIKRVVRKASKVQVHDDNDCLLFMYEGEIIRVTGPGYVKFKEAIAGDLEDGENVEEAIHKYVLDMKESAHKYYAVRDKLNKAERSLRVSRDLRGKAQTIADKAIEAGERLQASYGRWRRYTFYLLCYSVIMTMAFSIGHGWFQ